MTDSIWINCLDKLQEYTIPELTKKILLTLDPNAKDNPEYIDSMQPIFAHNKNNVTELARILAVTVDNKDDDMLTINDIFTYTKKICQALS